MIELTNTSITDAEWGITPEAGLLTQGMEKKRRFGSLGTPETRMLQRESSAPFEARSRDNGREFHPMKGLIPRYWRSAVDFESFARAARHPLSQGSLVFERTSIARLGCRLPNPILRARSHRSRSVVRCACEDFRMGAGLL